MIKSSKLISNFLGLRTSLYSVESIIPIHFLGDFIQNSLNTYSSLKSPSLSEIVNILYCNIDSILINESDYLKLKELGYISDKLGDFKLEYVFKEFCIKSPKKWIGIIDSTEYKDVRRPRKLEISFEDFINS